MLKKSRYFIVQTLVLVTILFLSSCTTVSVTQPDGTVWSYSSARDLENVAFDFRKSMDLFTVKVRVGKVETRVAGKIAEGLAKGAIKGIIP